MNLRLRPRFSLRVDLSAQQVQQRFAPCVDSSDAPFDLFLDDDQVEMTVPERERHFWSPYLKLRIRREEGTTVLRGKFGPNIHVWSMFLAAYAVLVLTGSAGLMIGASQWMIGQPPTGLWLLAGCVLLSVVVWLAGQIGRRWAYDQMVDIHRFVHERLADAIVDPVYCEACDGDDSVPG